MDYVERAETIARLLAEITRNLHRDLQKTIGAFGLTVPQFFVLRLLDKLGDLSVSEIGERVGLTNSTVSGILDRLEKEGLVLRKRDEKDRRVVNVGLTDKSRKLRREILGLKPDYFNHWIKDLEPHEVDSIIDSLNKLVRALE